METCLGDFLVDKLLSSYRTYEEWKLKGVSTAVAVMKVLTVPMRNGNFYYKADNEYSDFEFLPYL